MNYLKFLTEEIHSVIAATIAQDGHPQTRIIDMMLWDEHGLYFLTAKGKSFYDQLMKQRYLAISALKDQKAVSIRGKVRNIGSEKLDVIFEKNTYMKQIYPGDTRKALEVFCLYEGQGEFFDLSDPSHIFRDDIVLGRAAPAASGYWIADFCTNCGICQNACPQNCIDLTKQPARIMQDHCLHCGQCLEVCPEKAVFKR